MVPVLLPDASATAGLVVALENVNLGAALGQVAGGSQTGEPGTDDDDLGHGPTSLQSPYAAVWQSRPSSANPSGTHSRTAVAPVADTSVPVSRPFGQARDHFDPRKRLGGWRPTCGCQGKAPTFPVCCGRGSDLRPGLTLEPVSLPPNLSLP